MDPARRKLCSGDWATSARLLVAKFRADSARHIGDPAFEELIASLLNREPRILQGVEAPRGRRPRHGTQGAEPPVWPAQPVFDSGLHPSESPEQRLVLYTPVRETGTAEKIACCCQTKFGA